MTSGLFVQLTSCIDCTLLDYKKQESVLIIGSFQKKTSHCLDDDGVSQQST